MQKENLKKLVSKEKKVFEKIGAQLNKLEDSVSNLKQINVEEFKLNYKKVKDEFSRAEKACHNAIRLLLKDYP